MMQPQLLRRRFGYNLAARFSGNLLNFCAGFAFLLFVARALGPAAFGSLAAALAVTQVVGGAADLGLTTLVARRLAMTPDRAAENLDYAWTCRALTIPLSVALVMAVSLADSVNGPLIRIMAIPMASGLVSSLAYAAFQGLERMDYPVAAQVSEPAARLGASVLLVRMGAGVTGVAWSYALGGCVSLLISVAMCTAVISVARLRFSIRGLRSMMKAALPFWVIELLVLLSVRSGFLLLYTLVSPEAVGIYSAAFKVRDSLSVIPIALTAAAFPIFSRHSENPERARPMFERCFLFLLATSLPLAAAGTSQAEQLVHFLYGRAYEGSGQIMSLCLWYVALAWLSWTPGTLLLSMGRLRATGLITAAQLLLTVVLGYLLTKIDGYRGMAIAITVVEAVVLGAYLVYIKRNLFTFSLGNRALPIFVASAAVAFAARVMPSLSLPVTAVSLASAYVALVIVLYGGWRSALASIFPSDIDAGPAAPESVNLLARSLN